ncbi:glycoside hydrolase family 16 protein [Backusella circina FSU 941]|nr:glycoside hydrolase family 16 protein [Backusella circina FSU 941]
MTLTEQIELGSPSNCDCGYTDNTDIHWTEMWHKDFDTSNASISNLYTQKDLFFANYEIGPKYDKTLSRIFKKENVNVVNGLLELAITVNNGSYWDSTPQVYCGGFGTTRQDFLYGSFRSYMKLTTVEGTVAGMFVYHPEGEIDIEILSSVKPPQAYFAVHPGLIGEDGRASFLTHENHELGFDPTEASKKKKKNQQPRMQLTFIKQAFHEYRFDWFPNLVIFYIDGIEWYQMTTNILNQPSRFMFNHWTDGNQNFSQGPPVENAYLYIKSMTFFFNYTNEDNVLVSPACQNTQNACRMDGI